MRAIYNKLTVTDEPTVDTIYRLMVDTALFATGGSIDFAADENMDEILEYIEKGYN